MRFYVGNENNPSGLVIKGDFYTTDPDIIEDPNMLKNLRIIIVTGNAYISSNYEGLIFVGGDLHIDESVVFRKDAPGVSNAFEADNLKGKEAIGKYKIKNFLKGDILNQYSESESYVGEAWNIEHFVCYSKWKKN